MNAKVWQIAKSLRVLNLAMIALTMLLVRFGVVLPVVEQTFRMSSSMADWQFVLLVLATLFIAAAGYLMNDVYDHDIDQINKPFKLNVLGWNERAVVTTCMVLNLAGMGMGYAISYMVGNLHMGIFFVLAAVILLAYSRVLKKIVLLGNLAVSLLAGLAVLLPALMETNLLLPADHVAKTAAKLVWIAVAAYAFFAFLTNLIREIVKDIEDMQGDELGGRRTLPIVAGERPAKYTVIILLLVLVRSVLFAQHHFIVDGDYLIVGYLALAVQIPAISGMFMAYGAKSVKDYSRLSGLIKFIMFAGTLSMLLYTTTL